MKKMLLLIIFPVLILATGCSGMTSMLNGAVGGMKPGFSPGAGNIRNLGVEYTKDDFEVIKKISIETSLMSFGWGAFASGDNGITKLYEAAKKAGGDDVINIRYNVSFERVVWGVMDKVNIKLYAYAIKWKKGTFDK